MRLGEPPLSAPCRAPYGHGVARRAKNITIKGFTQVVPHPRAQLILTSPNTVVPTRFTVGVALEDPRVVVDLDIRVAAGGQPLVAEVGVKSFADGLWISSTILRSIPLDHLVRAAMNFAQRPTGDSGDLPFGLFRVEGDTQDVVRSSPLPDGSDRATVAARIYASALASGSNAPTEAVANEMHVSRSQASRYIRAARKAGLLPPTNRREQAG